MAMDEEKTKTSPKRTFYYFLSAFVLFVVGACFAFFILAFVYVEGPLSAEYWALLGTGALIIWFLLYILRIRMNHVESKVNGVKEKEEEESRSSANTQMRTDFEKFKRDSLHAFRGVIKFSSLFWIHYTKKEKAKSLEEAKKEIFRNLKKEFSSISWMDELLEEVQKDIARFEGPLKKNPPESGDQNSDHKS